MQKDRILYVIHTLRFMCGFIIFYTVLPYFCQLYIISIIIYHYIIFIL